MKRILLSVFCLAALVVGSAAATSATFDSQAGAPPKCIKPCLERP